MVSSSNTIVMSSEIFLVLDWSAVLKAGLANWAGWRRAVSADIEWSASTMEVMSSILFTRRVWDTLGESELVHRSRLST